jgi:hypothetical protein
MKTVRDTRSSSDVARPVVLVDGGAEVLRDPSGSRSGSRRSRTLRQADVCFSSRVVEQRVTDGIPQVVTAFATGEVAAVNQQHAVLHDPIVHVIALVVPTGRSCFSDEPKGDRQEWYVRAATEELFAELGKDEDV